jgi:DNA polymerase/3'-5' exonuclease PolX
MDYNLALPLAERMLDLLAPGCKRIEIAGGLRRQKADPHDIELVAIPDLRPPRPIFGSPAYATILDAIMASLARGDDDDCLIHLSLNGPKFKQFQISQDGGQHWLITLDLFLCTPPSDWGVLYLIRTGPFEFSHWIVTQRWQGGGLPNGYHVEDNRILSRTNNEYIPCPEEIDFLNFCQLDWIAPSIRRPLWQRSVRRIEVHQPVKL